MEETNKKEILTPKSKAVVQSLFFFGLGMLSAGFRLFGLLPLPFALFALFFLGKEKEGFLSLFGLVFSLLTNLFSPTLSLLLPPFLFLCLLRLALPFCKTYATFWLMPLIAFLSPLLPLLFFWPPSWQTVLFSLLRGVLAVAAVLCMAGLLRGTAKERRALLFLFLTAFLAAAGGVVFPVFSLAHFFAFALLLLSAKDRAVCGRLALCSALGLLTLGVEELPIMTALLAAGLLLPLVGKKTVCLPSLVLLGLLFASCLPFASFWKILGSLCAFCLAFLLALWGQKAFASRVFCLFSEKSLPKNELPLPLRCRSFCQKKAGEVCSGDLLSQFDAKGFSYTLLADGMGSGEVAAGDAKAVCDALKALLIRGLPPEEALAVAGKEVFLQTEGERPVALDLLCQKGSDFVLFKMGSAPSILFSENANRLLSASDPPVGGLPETTFTRHAFSLLEGEALLLQTDGVDFPFWAEASAFFDMKNWVGDSDDATAILFTP